MMIKTDTQHIVLAAEDDEDDRMLIKDAFSENKANIDLRFVENGELLISYLNHIDGFNDNNAPRPDLILLDLNLPKKAGLEALEEIKANAKIRNIPVVALTTSQSDEDVFRGYALGISGFLVKPLTFDELVKLIGKLDGYWFGAVKLRSDY